MVNPSGAQPYLTFFPPFSSTRGTSKDYTGIKIKSATRCATKFVGSSRSSWMLTALGRFLRREATTHHLRYAIIWRKVIRNENTSSYPLSLIHFATLINTMQESLEAP